MAVHVPLSHRGADGSARAHDVDEQHPLARRTASPIIVPSQDIVLGLYYMTRERPFAQGRVPATEQEGRAPIRGVFALARGSAHGVRPRRARPAGGDQRPHRRRARGRAPPSAACCCTRSCPTQLPFKIVNHVMGKKQLAELIDICYRACGQKETVLLADTAAARSGYTLRDQGRHLDLHRRHAHPDAQGRAARDGAEGRRRRSRSSTPRVSSPTASATTRSSTSGRRSSEQIAKEMMKRDRRPKSVDERRDRREEAQPVVQPDLHHGRLGRARLGAADPAAGRHARPHGQAVGRDHRDADHHELPRGPVGAPVLHLDARRPQGSGRHRAQDGELRVPDPPSRRRGAGLRSSPSTTAAPSTGIEIGAAGRRRRDHRDARRPHPRPRRRSRTSSTRTRARCWSPSNEEITEEKVKHHRGRGHRPREDPLGAHLRDPARHLRRCATAATWRAGTWSTSARRSASSPRSRSASPARS